VEQIVRVVSATETKTSWYIHTWTTGCTIARCKISRIWFQIF